MKYVILLFIAVLGLEAHFVFASDDHTYPVSRGTSENTYIEKTEIHSRLGLIDHNYNFSTSRPQISIGAAYMDGTAVSVGVGKVWCNRLYTGSVGVENGRVGGSFSFTF